MRPRYAPCFGALALCCLPFINGCGDASDERAQRVEFWTISLRPTFNEYMNERIDAFESEHPHIEIEWVDVPFDAINRKLLAAAAAGRAPDVVNLSDLSFARYAAAGAFADLSILPQSTLETYHHGALALGTIADQQLALPWYLTTQAVMCNTVLLEEGGLTPESLATDWLDLIDQAEAYHARTGRALFTQPIGTDSQLPIMLFADDRPPLRVDDNGSLRANLTDPRVIHFLDRFVALYRHGGLPREAASKGFEHLIEVYQDRRVALVNTGPNFLSRIKDNAPQVFEVTAVKPAITGSLGATHIAVMPVSVSAHTEHPEASAAWATFITSPDSQLAFCKLATILPSTPSALDDVFFDGPTESEIAQGKQAVAEARAIIAGSLETAVPFTPSIECWPDLRRVFEEHIKRVLLDGTDLETEMARANERWNRIIDAMNKDRAAIGAKAAGSEALPTTTAQRAPLTARPPVHPVTHGAPR